MYYSSIMYYIYCIYIIVVLIMRDIPHVNITKLHRHWKPPAWAAWYRWPHPKTHRSLTLSARSTGCSDELYEISQGFRPYPSRHIQYRHISLLANKNYLQVCWSVSTKKCEASVGIESGKAMCWKHRHLSHCMDVIVPEILLSQGPTVLKPARSGLIIGPNLRMSGAKNVRSCCWKGPKNGPLKNRLKSKQRLSGGCTLYTVGPIEFQQWAKIKRTSKQTCSSKTDLH